MALKQLERIYQPTNVFIVSGPTAPGLILSLLYLRIPMDGVTIKRFAVFTGNPLDGVAAAVFNVSINGVNQFSGADRPQIASGAEEAQKTGLSIAANEGDEVVLDLIQNPRSGNLTPITFIVEYEDNVVGAGGKSAYEIAVQNGFVGTESQWLLLLRGADGAQGIQGIQGIQGQTGAVGSIASASYTTASIADGASQSGVITLGKSFVILKTAASAAARVRLYSTAAYLAADAARLIGILPTGEHGVIYDALLPVGNLTIDASPAAVGSNLETVRSNAIPIAVQNRSGSAQTVQITFTYLILED